MVQKTIRRFLQTRRTKHMVSKYHQVAVEVCQDQHEAIRALSVFPLKTEKGSYCNATAERLFTIVDMLHGYGLQCCIIRVGGRGDLTPLWR